MHLNSAIQLWGPSFEPSTISTVLGVTPTHAWKAGDVWIKNLTAGPVETRRRRSYWCLQLYSGDDADSSFAINRITNFLKSSTNSLTDVLTLGVEEGSLYLTVTTNEYALVPLTKNFLKIASELWLEVNIQLRVNVRPSTEEQESGR